MTIVDGALLAEMPKQCQMVFSVRKDKLLATARHWLKCNGMQGNAVPPPQFMAQSVPHLRLL